MCEALDLPADCIDESAVLDLARDVAHGVDRPAAPLTAYLAGVAVGRGIPLAQASATITALIPPEAPASRRKVRKGPFLYRIRYDFRSRSASVAARGPLLHSVTGSRRTMICFDVGVCEPSAVESSGTSTLASGK